MKTKAKSAESPPSYEIDKRQSSRSIKLLGGTTRVVKFTDPKLQQHVERAAGCVTGLPDDQQPVCGLLDAYQWFGRTEGEDSPIVAAALAHLLSPELRPALRSWYRRFGDDMNPTATEFRERLSELAGERFG